MVQNLQNESEELAVQLTRVQASKTEELTNARSMVEQQKHELETVKSRNVRRPSLLNGRKHEGFLAFFFRNEGVGVLRTTGVNICAAPGTWQSCFPRLALNFPFGFARD
jgi:hypothetical protein